MENGSFISKNHGNCGVHTLKKHGKWGNSYQNIMENWGFILTKSWKMGVHIGKFGFPTYSIMENCSFISINMEQLVLYPGIYHQKSMIPSRIHDTPPLSTIICPCYGGT